MYIQLKREEWLFICLCNGEIKRERRYRPAAYETAATIRKSNIPKDEVSCFTGDPPKRKA
ncbi:MAG: hypothetical protein M3P08_13080 [Thermoproteota archaeon]|nr:hypothetical protein [Thermoproteota archaeon]